MKKLVIIGLILLTVPRVTATCYDYPRTRSYPEWSSVLYYGKMTNDNLGNVLIFNYSLHNDTLYSLEISKELTYTNPIRTYLQPVMSSVDFRANFTLLEDTYGLIYELNPYLAFNWNQYWWNSHLRTIISVGEGISYVTKVPYTEEHNSDQPKKLLNFLLFEIGFVIPGQPQLEIVTRIHHRSGAFGLYHANNSGSTAIGLGVRYRFGLFK